jgi:hypothetical protein
MAEWQDTLIVDVGPSDVDGTEQAWAAWEVDIDQVTSIPDPITDKPLVSRLPGRLVFSIDLPAAGRNLLGSDAALTIEVETSS